MKILFPCATFFPAQTGGPSNTLYWHTRNLRKRKLYPIIITSDYCIDDNVELIRGRWIDNSFGRIIYFRELYQGFPFKTLRCSLNQIRNVDVIHFNGMLNRVTLFLLLAAVIKRVPIVLSPRGELFEAAVKRKTMGKKIIFNLYAMIKHKLLFHATSIEEESIIKEYFGNVNVVLQPNFIEADYSNKIKSGQRDFLYLGRINPIKNLHILIEGASKSDLFMRTDSRIVIAGKAWLNYELKYLSEINDLINTLAMQDKVVFKGHVENNEKMRLLCDAYFLVLPSKSENFGNVVVEALTKGTPVIATKGTPWEVLHERNAGFWIESDADSIKTVIDKALGVSEKDYSEYCNNARNLIKSTYDIDSRANKWNEIYAEVRQTSEPFR